MYYMYFDHIASTVPVPSEYRFGYGVTALITTLLMQWQL